MSAIPTAWDKLEIEDSELDPVALAKALAHLDIEDDEERKQLMTRRARPNLQQTRHGISHPSLQMSRLTLL